MNSKIKLMVNLSLLIAIEVVLSRFCSISTPIIKIGFGFVPVAVCAIMYGPVWAGAAGAIADFIGAVLFPIGPFFPGFTLSAALTGVVFGLFLYKKHGGWIQLGCAVMINCLMVSLILNTYWLTLTSGTSFAALFPARIIQSLIMIPVQFVVLRLLQKPIALYIRRSIGTL